MDNLYCGLIVLILCLVFYFYTIKYRSVNSKPKIVKKKKVSFNLNDDLNISWNLQEQINKFLEKQNQLL